MDAPVSASRGTRQSLYRALPPVRFALMKRLISAGIRLPDAMLSAVVEHMEVMGDIAERPARLFDDAPGATRP